MKKVCFLVTHLCADADALLDTFAANPRIQVQRTGRVYGHPLALEELTALPHKTRNAAALWLDVLYHNYQFCNKALYPVCKFLYLVCPAERTLACLMKGGYEPDFAARYYCYRLRRLAEMARRTPGAILLTPDKPALDLVGEYLSLREALVPPSVEPAAPGRLNWELVQRCQQRYEWHLYYMKQFLRFER